VTWRAEDTQVPAIRAAEIEREFFVPISIAQGISLAVATDLPHGFARVAAAADGSMAIGVLLRESCPIGEFRLRIHLKPTTSDGVELDVEPLQIRGELAAEVSVEPRELVFDSVPVGHARTQSLVFAAAEGQSAFRVEEMEIDGDGVSLTEGAPSNQRRVEYLVTCAPTSHGSRRGTVRFKVASSERPEPLQFEIPVVWHGTNLPLSDSSVIAQ
jgi:hypothetical protein